MTGGVVYARHGAAARSAGRYVYGDFCSGALWTLPARRRAAPRTSGASGRTVPQLTHIGTDADGELVFASGAARLYRAVPAGAGS